MRPGHEPLEHRPRQHDAQEGTPVDNGSQSGFGGARASLLGSDDVRSHAPTPWPSKCPLCEKTLAASGAGPRAELGGQALKTLYLLRAGFGLAALLVALVAGISIRNHVVSAETHAKGWNSRR